ncbi:class I SAM-dependent methyltransferase [uncultured Formosa sp.]|uniref:class I SAM-dependent methyltransferase n=1 Tax=uncultured Formosa sp. TaxID=255435 RepID=UPI00260E551B|nr:class I SAM-dependent methyltransferase [uncultured Formosa sp.]
MKDKTKTPWPTKAAMEQVYDMKLWGENQSDFYSGDGSHHPELVHPYIDVLVSFLSKFSPPLAVCDLGCGDFNVGKHLVAYASKYTAVDIVPKLIQRNQAMFKDKKLRFECLDIATDTLPSGDCVILRQVLQHLSNTEIQSILKKLTVYKYIILTEHLPESNFTPNADIISGQGIRLKKQSGVNILEAPFNFKVKNTTQLLKVVQQQAKGVIITTCYTLY